MSADLNLNGIWSITEVGTGRVGADCGGTATGTHYLTVTLDTEVNV